LICAGDGDPERQVFQINPNLTLPESFMLTVTPLNSMLDRMATLSRAMDQAFTNGNQPAATWVPGLDAIENEEAYVVSLDLPGLTPEQVDINFDRNTLTVRGVREYADRNKEGVRVLLAERDWGAFERSLRFPQHVESEKIAASFANGVLTITVPKSEAAKPRRIAITG
jgi:HSP20 family protein